MLSYDESTRLVAHRSGSKPDAPYPLACRFPLGNQSRNIAPARWDLPRSWTASVGCDHAGPTPLRARLVQHSHEDRPITHGQRPLARTENTTAWHVPLPLGTVLFRFESWRVPTPSSAQYGRATLRPCVGCRSRRRDRQQRAPGESSKRVHDGEPDQFAIVVHLPFCFLHLPVRAATARQGYSNPLRRSV